MKDTFDLLIRVKWPGGHLTIARDLAFPAAADWLKTFLKVVRLDYRQVEILEDLEEYLEYNVGRCEAEAKLSDDKNEAKLLRSKAKRYASNLKTIRKRLEVLRQW